MSEVIAKAIDALNDGETNNFVDTINKELLHRAQDAIATRKVAVAQTLFDDDIDDEDEDIDLDDVEEDEDIETEEGDGDEEI
jgi:hypothetical protein|tara:strand:- start:24 stop:269 length:246 start_codon:yes stop_codon:yes gene_type:complete